jgi:hypothetical protein
MKKIMIEQFITGDGSRFDTEQEALEHLLEGIKTELHNLLARYDVPEAKALACKIVTVELAEENASLQYIGGLMQDASSVSDY